MANPLTLARLEVTNAQGVFDSQASSATRGDGLDRARIRGTITKTLDPTANTAEISIYNLSSATVAEITGLVVKRIEWSPEEQDELLRLGASDAPIETIYDNFGLASIRLAWGYQGDDPTSPQPPLSLGFIGGSTSIRESNDGQDTVLTFKVEDGGQLLGAARLVKAYRANTDTTDILGDLINACGVRVDRTKLKAAMLSALNARGIPLTGLNQGTGYNASTTPAATQITSIMNALELKWSIQDGEFLLLDTTTVLAGYPPLILSAANGTLFGNPEQLEASQMVARTWATAEARPGRQVEIAATALGTQYRIHTAKTTFDTYSGGSTIVTLDALKVIPGVF